MNIFTSHSALSIPLLKEVVIDPDALKEASRIDRIGNLAPRNTTTSLILLDIARFALGDAEGITGAFAGEEAGQNAGRHAGRYAGQHTGRNAGRYSGAADAGQHGGAAGAAPESMPGLHVSLSELPAHLINDLTETLRMAIVHRQQVLVSLLPIQAVDALKEIFGKDLTVRVREGEGTGEDAPPRPDLLCVIGPETRLEDHERLAHELASRGFALEDEWTLVPVAISPSAWCQSWCKAGGERHDLLERAFNWVESATISSKNYRALKEAGIRTIPSSKAYRMLRSPKFWAYAVVFVYSCLRALPVAFVDSFQGNLWILWGMDVITAIPYTWGILAFVTAHKFWLRYTGLLVTLITFISPYVYFWTHGRDYPVGVNAIVIGMIVTAVLYEARNFIRDHKVSVGLRVA